MYMISAPSLSQVSRRALRTPRAKSDVAPATAASNVSAVRSEHDAPPSAASGDTLDSARGVIAPHEMPASATRDLADATDVGEPGNGDRRMLDGTEYIHFHGYWVRWYEPLAESMAARKRLIDHLTRRAFHHTEPGINTPGERLALARSFWEKQTDPAMKRVNAAMLAGALFNRATDIFTAIVELEEKGVRISRSNELMKACGDCFKEALELGRDVRHVSGEEGIDELWGEPFRAFTLPIAAYYESRYIKIAQTMTNIDRLGEIILDTLGQREEFIGLQPLVDEFAASARHECETMKADESIFDIWPRFVAAGEALGNVRPKLKPDCSRECSYVLEEAHNTLIAGRDLINWVARARVPMPESTRLFTTRCELLKGRLAAC